jgi:Protein of unknown function (DUF3300)
MTRHAIRSVILALVLLLPFGALAQTPNQTQSASTPGADLLKPPELDALVAPIALYPDPLITNILMASTYPLEVVQADRWLDQNKSLQGDALKSAAEQQSWDDSVKALLAAPDVVDMMSNQLAWTQKLGDAVLAQESDVMDAIQRLRGRAYDNKKLSTTEQQTIKVNQVVDRQVIEIEPASTDSLYVPYYDPATVYGEWPYPDYAAYPYYWPAPGYIGAGVLATGIAFGAGYGLGRWGWNSNYWRGNINWSNRNINIRNGGRVEHWQHNPQHRQGVRYNNAGVQQRFGGANRAGLGGGRGGAAGAAALGGAAGAALGRAGQGRGERAGAGNRGQGKAAANRGGNRQAAGNRGNRQAGAGHRGGGRAHAATRPAGGANRAMARGGAGGRGGAGMARSRGSFASAGRVGMGGARMGGGGARGGGGGGRRSDIRLKHDIVLLGHLDDGLGFYRFAYNGSDKAYVGMIAQEVRSVVPSAVLQGRDGYLRVRYDRLGAKIPSGPR